MSPHHAYQFPIDGEFLQDAHSEFVRLYNEYDCQIRAMWHKLDKNERARLFLGHFTNRNVHRHGGDDLQKQTAAMFPELNLNNVSTSAGHLLKHFEHRANMSLFEQCWAGLDGALGDGPFITEKVNQKQLIPDEKPNYYIIISEDCYGDVIRLDKEKEEALESMMAMTEGDFCVPQFLSLVDFRCLILALLEKTPRSWWTKAQWEKLKQERPAAAERIKTPEKLAEKLSTTGKAPEKMSLAQILFNVQRQRGYLEDYLAILRDEPSVLVYNVNSWLLSRPELVTDDQGRHLPLETNKHISCAIFEAIRGWVQKFAIWSYIYNLLEMLDNADTKPDYKRVILQEISNVCHFEYNRAQAHFIRHVQTGIGARCFRRVANAYDDAGNPKVFMKIKPQELSQGDYLLQHMLRLCQSQTSASQAAQWIDKLDELHNSKPSDWKPLQQREMDALCELMAIVLVIQQFSISLSVPSLSRKTGQTFLEGSRELNSGLNDIRKEIDLQEFSVPITKLLEPGMANRALAQLDDFVVRNMGSKMDFLYHYAVQECLVYHRTQSQKTEDAPEEIEQSKFPFTIAYFIAEGVDLKKYEENRSPVQTSTSENEQAANKPNEAQLWQLYASPAAKRVFSTLFKEPTAGTSITWAAFESAMVATGFSVKIGYCAHYTFVPPGNMPVKTTLLVVRPLNSKIEGHLISTLARRLKKAYGRFMHFG
ncbi:hypothetical protein V8C34DRAFT_321657 [Trichoderma compactum]